MSQMSIKLISIDVCVGIRDDMELPDIRTKAVPVLYGERSEMRAFLDQHEVPHLTLCDKQARFVHREVTGKDLMWANWRIILKYLRYVGILNLEGA